MAHAARAWPRKDADRSLVQPKASTSSGWPVLGRAVLVLAVAWVALEVLALLLGLAVVGRHGNGPIQGWDNTVEQWSIGHRAHVVAVSKVIAALGDAPALGALCVAATIVLLVLRQRVRAFVPLFAYVGGEALVFVTRQVVTRHRPPTANYPAPHAVPGVHETSASFPSGHATAAVAVLVSLAALAVYTWPKVWGLLIAIVLALAAVFVAWSRLVLGVHWFSDVAFGMVLGVPWGLTVALTLRDLPWPRRLRRTSPIEQIPLGRPLDGAG